jgi:biopolymer transport protein ExbB
MSLTDKFLQFALLGAEWVLWLLIVLSIISVYVMIERAVFFRSLAGADENVRRPLLTAIRKGDLATARKLVADAIGPGGRMVKELLSVPTSPKAYDAALGAVRPAERLRLEKNLSFLGTLGANAPFIGLFGTVLGIMQAFNELAQSGLQASGENTTKIMGGISEALVATAVGLLVAIPAVVAYNLFQRAVKRRLGEADAMANSCVASLTDEVRGGRPGGED